VVVCPRILRFISFSRKHLLGPKGWPSYEMGGREVSDSWRAKSGAYHHSRNLRTKMLVGSSILSELSNRGCTVRPRFPHEKLEPPSPGRADPNFRGAVASTIAL
jgi:hypothetical protein